MAQEPRNRQLTIRIPKRIYDLFEKQAERERRTVADVVNNLFEEHHPVAATKLGPVLGSRPGRGRSR